jgi:hypothetical protein
MEVQRLELMLSMKRIWSYGSETLVDGGDWLYGANLGTAIVAPNNRKLLSLEQAA